MSFWSKTVKLITGYEPEQRPPRKRKVTRRDLIRMESEIGSKLFGPVPKGHRREFFYLDNDTWVWYEEWTDKSGKQQELTTRYEIHPNGIIKVQDGHPYTLVEGEELKNLHLAIQLYYEKVSHDIYKIDVATRQPIAS